MSIGKAILATFIYILVGQTISLWSLIPTAFGYLGALKFYHFVNSLLLMIVMYFFVRKHRLKDQPLPQPTPAYWYGVAILVGVAFVFCQYPLIKLFNALVHQPITESKFFIFSLEKFKHPAIIGTILFTPIAEELFFREYQQKWLHQRYSVALVITVNAFIFACIHLPYVNWIFGSPSDWGRQAYIVFFGAILQGIIYYKSKSVGPAIAMHMSWNIMANF